MSERRRLTRSLERLDPVATRIDSYWGALKVVAAVIVAVAVAVWGGLFVIYTRVGFAWSISLVLTTVVLVLAVVIARMLRRWGQLDQGLGGEEHQVTAQPRPMPTERREATVRAVEARRPTSTGSHRGSHHHRSDEALADDLQDLHDEGTALLERCSVNTVTQALAVGGGQPDETEVFGWSRRVESLLAIHPSLLSKFRRQESPLTNIGRNFLMTPLHRELRTKMAHLADIIRTLRGA